MKHDIRITSTLCLLILTFFTGNAIAESPELTVNDDAPDWTLPANDGKTYQLSELTKDRAVVVAWYPRAFTAGCTIECKSLKANGNLIREYDVDYFMASVDEIDLVKAFAEEHDADFPLLSDPSKETALKYGLLHPRGFAMRYTIYVGKGGKILEIDKVINPSTAAEDIAAKLEELGVPKRIATES